MGKKLNDMSKKKPNKSRWDTFARQLGWSLGTNKKIVLD